MESSPFLSRSFYCQLKLTNEIKYMYDHEYTNIYLALIVASKVIIKMF
mgnify:CR=1 FL=1